MTTLASTSKWTLDYATTECVDLLTRSPESPVLTLPRSSCSSSRSSIRDPPGYSPQLSVKVRPFTLSEPLCSAP